MLEQAIIASLRGNGGPTSLPAARVETETPGAVTVQDLGRTGKSAEEIDDMLLRRALEMSLQEAERNSNPVSSGQEPGANKETIDSAPPTSE